MSESETSVVVVGRILGAYGLQGWVHVAALTEEKGNLLEYGPWLLADAGGSWHPAEVRDVRPHGPGFVAWFDGVDDRDGARALKGWLIGVPDSALPAPAADEYYWRELIGASVVDAAGAMLGRVDGLLETGVHDVLVIRRPDGGELLIPFHDRYVLAVDRSGPAIRVDWPGEGD